jgi:NADH dehydrogenase
VTAALVEADLGPVRCLVHRPEHARVLSPFKVELARGDVLSSSSLREAMGGVKSVVHLVAIIRERRPNTTFERVNHLGTRNVVEAAREAGVDYLVHLSAIGAQDNPHLRYAHSKWLGEQEVAKGGVPFTILRPSIMFGEGDEFFNMLAAVARLFPVVPVAGTGRNRFQPVAVEDVARCVALCVRDRLYQGQVIELGGPEQFTYDEIVRLVLNTLRVRRATVHIPLPVMRMVAALMGLALPRPPVTLEQLKYLRLDSLTDVDSVQRHFGFQPRPLRDNLGYIRRVGLRDALKVNLGVMPHHIRDH